MTALRAARTRGARGKTLHAAFIEISVHTRALRCPTSASYSIRVSNTRTSRPNAALNPRKRDSSTASVGECRFV